MPEHLDILRLRNMMFHGYHGNDPRERELGQQYHIDVWLFFDMTTPAQSDRVRDTVNYVDVYNTIESIVVGNRFKLVERLAGVIAETCLVDFPIAGVEVWVRKPRPPIPAALDYLEIRMTRGKVCRHED
jgi:7,8-dihydroneopterin aldolase/epimerase/oxygenase